MDDPDIIPTYITIPAHPSDTTTLDLIVKLDQMYHPCYISHPPYNAILLAVFSLLRTYTTRCPHFACRTPLSKKSHLKTVRITIALPEDGMTYFYGDPLQRIETLFLDFETYLIKFARSGRLFAEVGAFEYGIEGKEMKRVCVAQDR